MRLLSAVLPLGRASLLRKKLVEAKRQTVASLVDSGLVTSPLRKEVSLPLMTSYLFMDYFHLIN